MSSLRQALSCIQLLNKDLDQIETRLSEGGFVSCSLPSEFFPECDVSATLPPHMPLVLCTPRELIRKLCSDKSKIFVSLGRYIRAGATMVSGKGRGGARLTQASTEQIVSVCDHALWAIYVIVRILTSANLAGKDRFTLPLLQPAVLQKLTPAIETLIKGSSNESEFHVASCIALGLVGFLLRDWGCVDEGLLDIVQSRQLKAFRNLSPSRSQSQHINSCLNHDLIQGPLSFIMTLTKMFSVTTKALLLNSIPKKQQTSLRLLCLQELSSIETQKNRENDKQQLLKILEILDLTSCEMDKTLALTSLESQLAKCILSYQ